jgi:DNA-binding IclR family transcriptional regulator
MDGIEEFLRVLNDGNWHRTGDLASELGWTWSRTRRLAEFLSEHGLVHYRRLDESVMLDAELLDLLRET